jgi:hypothetical protein
VKRFITILLAFFTVVTAQAATAEPVIDFHHKFAKVNLTMKLSKVKTLNKFMPNSLRREIGDEYYPAIRRQLLTKSSMTFKEGAASVVRYPEGKIRLTLDFPNFRMTIRETTWEELDAFFTDYFYYKGIS